MPVLTSNEFLLLADKCTQISEGISNEDGFVSAQSLADWFDADLILRPLLVEGMLASKQSGSDQSDIDGNARQWAVFLDSEQYKQVKEGDIACEDSSASLPPRLRNTIAHELVHSIAFRSTEFSIKLNKSRNKNESRSDFVKAIEEETEKLSPLLLIPYSFLEMFYTKDRAKVSISEVQAMVNKLGVSRYIFINRLKFLKILDKKDILYRPGLRNTAIGIGRWISNNRANLHPWPIFFNFDRNILPDFIANITRGKVDEITEHLNDPTFCLSGGNNYYCEATVLAGTTQTPGSERMKISCSIEMESKTRGAEFLYLIKTEE